MSYVFSKALQETPEEKEQRLAAQRKRWAANRAATFDSAAKNVVPPPVAAKPKLKPTTSLDTSASGNNVGGSQASTARAAFRKTSLPTRSYSVDIVDSDVPKMGGAFARLAAKMEQDGDGTTSSSSSSGFYRNKFEEYKAKRSLELHGCLPSSMRSNEQRRKYSIDSSSASRKYSSESESSVERKYSSESSPGRKFSSGSSSPQRKISSERGSPPQVLPKPRRPSAENKRDVFARNRSMTSPTISSSGYSSEPTSSPNKSRTSSSSSLAHDVLTEEFEQIFNTINLTPVKSETTTPPRKSSTNIFDVNPQEIELAEKSPQVMKMKEEIALEKSKLTEGKEDLSQTIAELEQFDFDLSINGKSPDDKNEQLESEAPELKESSDSKTNEESDAIDDKLPDIQQNNAEPNIPQKDNIGSNENLDQSGESPDSKTGDAELGQTTGNSDGETDGAVSASTNNSGVNAKVSLNCPEIQDIDHLTIKTTDATVDISNEDTENNVNDESKDSGIETPDDNITNESEVIIETEDMAIVPISSELISDDIAKENLDGQRSHENDPVSVSLTDDAEPLLDEENQQSTVDEVDLNQNAIISSKFADTEATNDIFLGEINHSGPVTAV
ncbi:uncharacterized protein [Clytia hemisphaerica]|uniref:Uncharacterized protein n=1 Tax=Clytia hemisphaerica TaxID=252671 RepID=A0A7M5XEH2_9CNID